MMLGQFKVGTATHCLMPETNTYCAASIRCLKCLTGAANVMYEPSQFVRGLDMKGRTYLTNSKKKVRTSSLCNGVQNEPTSFEPARSAFA